MHGSMEGVTGDEPALPPQHDVVVVEVGPRDGLQNETSSIPTGVKIAFVDALTAAGLPVIEVTSFVNPKAVPQLADASEVMTGIRRASSTRYPVLVPNYRGFERAVAAGADAIALFTSATETFSQANVGASIDGTFERFEPVVDSARRRASGFGATSRFVRLSLFRRRRRESGDPSCRATAPARLRRDLPGRYDRDGDATMRSQTHCGQRGSQFPSIGWLCISMTPPGRHWLMWSRPRPRGADLRLGYRGAGRMSIRPRSARQPQYGAIDRTDGSPRTVHRSRF